MEVGKITGGKLVWGYPLRSCTEWKGSGEISMISMGYNTCLLLCLPLKGNQEKSFQLRKEVWSVVRLIYTTAQSQG